jgi:hypothetical protein
MRETKILRLSNGEKYFYQWDTGRKLLVNDSECTQVHFSNEYTDLALTCQIYELDGNRVVNVPNIILQVAKPITVHLNLIDKDGRLTSYSEILPVVPRKKPEDYIYTETEVLNYNSLVSRIEQIEKNGVSDEQIATAVEKYLDENPIDTGVNFETDHTLTLKDGILSVNTTDQMEQDNTLPMTSAGVYATVGNIEALLKTI